MPTSDFPASGLLGTRSRRPALAAPSEIEVDASTPDRPQSYPAKPLPIVGLLLARGLRPELTLLGLLVFFVEGWWLSPIPRMDWQTAQQWIDLAIAFHWLLTCLLWPALVGPVVRERLDRMGELPVVLREAGRWTAWWTLFLGQTMLFLPALIWSLMLTATQPRIAAYLQCASILAILGMQLGALWMLGRQWWGPSTLRPGLWILAGHLLGLTLILIDPAQELFFEKIYGLTTTEMLLRQLDPYVRSWWTPWLIDMVQQRWAWDAVQSMRPLRLEEWTFAQLLVTLGLQAVVLWMPERGTDELR